MTPFSGEILGTMLLLLLGDGTVANVALAQSKAYGGGWMVVATGWGLAVFVGSFLVWAIGLALGGPTGYAINPARDLGPRIMHAMLPIAGKGDSDWPYAWVPVVGPLIGAALAAALYLALGQF